MEDFVDHYAVLGVSRQASPAEIKRAYLDRCYILHPDRLQGAPESAKRSAEEELKKVNKAYEILKDTRKRAAYDAQWAKQKDKPRPIVEPKVIQFKDIRQGETRSASFVISNVGGPYEKIWFNNPDTWAKVVSWQSISSSEELPLRVNIEVEGPSPGKTLSEVIQIKLDDVETSLIVNIETKSGVAKSKKSGLGIFDIFKKGAKTEPLKPPFTLTDHKWHELDYQSLPNWIKKRRVRLDAGEELVGKIFIYRRNYNTEKYEIRLRYRHKKATFH